MALAYDSTVDDARRENYAGDDLALHDKLAAWRKEGAAAGYRVDATDENILKDQQFIDWTPGTGNTNFVSQDGEARHQAPQSQTLAQQWTQPLGGPNPAALTGGWGVPQVEQQAATGAAQNAARNTSLYDTLLARSQQNPIPDRNDPTIRAQADAYSANEERARRNYVADMAERSNPMATGAMEGQRLMAAERMGQRTGSFEASLIGQELQARRAEIAQDLQMLMQMGATGEAQQLQRELALLDQIIRQQGLGLQQQGLNQDWQKTLLGNDQFMANLGLQAEDRSAYWDALRRGLI